MENINKDAQTHLEAAKDELKSAAHDAAEHAKDKVNSVIEGVAESIGDAAEKIQHDLKKEELAKK